MKKVILLLLLTLFSTNMFAQSVSKYQKWITSGYFRGYNVLYESPKSLQDFIDFKNYGGNIMAIGSDGFMDEDAPYAIQNSNIVGADLLVNYCRQTGIYYIIAVRSGPGAYDTYDESQGTTGESRIWNTGNTAEQQKYAEMLNMIVSRYANDSLFVGLNLVVEPRPKVKLIPANNSNSYKSFLENIFNIHMDQVYNSFISSIRTVDADLPLIIENFAYSTPELFPAYHLNDSYIIYSAHNYQPKEYTNANPPYSKTYPGTYWNITYLAQKYFDAAFMRNTVFSRLKEFQDTEGGKPVLIGELGILYPQTGCTDYINDVLGICKDYGWHFALWDWRRGSGQEWNIEHFPQNSPSKTQLTSWQTVLSYFHAPPVPNAISPVNDSSLRYLSYLKWDSLTSYTKYDVELFLENEMLFSAYELSNSSVVISPDILIEGRHYYWHVRSKNPGGQIENNSVWSPLYHFYVIAVTDNISESKKEFKLEGNYPNPFNPSTVIKYNIPSPAFVTLKIYDASGREVSTLKNEFQYAGSYDVNFNASNLSSGVFFYKLTVSNNGAVSFTSVKRMILIK